jgi:3-dehydroquinate synthase
MRNLTVNLGDRSYPVYIGNNLLQNPDLIRKLVTSSQVMIITDTTVEKLHLSRLLALLQGFEVTVHVIPDGEIHKNLETMNSIITVLLQNRFARTSNLIAFGGGVVGDLTGFTAACYQRGIRFLQIPTTLLAQVDSSVGGKTAVNHALGKNMIGAFHQPCGVIADVSVLQTLPARELSSGLAEVIKYGLIRDGEFYDWLESNIDKLVNRDPDALEYAIERSCSNKAAVVSEDETETGVRATLNLGHTFGHAVETGLNYKIWLHGEAVGLGMLMAAHMSMLCGWLTEQTCERIRLLLIRAGLPVKLPAELQDTDIRQLMSIDKKVSHGKLKLILLHGIGEAIITDSFPESSLLETIDHFRCDS